VGEATVAAVDTDTADADESLTTVGAHQQAIQERSVECVSALFVPQRKRHASTNAMQTPCKRHHANAMLTQMPCK
jgi:hypothetical protein